MSVADGLSLAASPTFAVMAFVSGVPGGGHAGMVGSSALSGMVTMYVLMAAFHAGPWLRLIHNRVASRA